MEEEEHRIAPIFAANRDPLRHAPELDVIRLIDRVRGRDRIVPRVPIAFEVQKRVELPQIGIAGRILGRELSCVCRQQKEAEMKGFHDSSSFPPAWSFAIAVRVDSAPRAGRSRIHERILDV
jgi:hypothetical protein